MSRDRPRPSPPRQHQAGAFIFCQSPRTESLPDNRIAPLRRLWANSDDRNPNIEISTSPAPPRPVTIGNPLLLLAISILRLFGNEDRHSTRLHRLHMVRLSPA